MIPVRKWMLLILTPLWRWKWLFLICLTITIGYGLFALNWKYVYIPPPVNFVTGPSIVPPMPPHTTMEHGWPCPCLYREIPSVVFDRRWTIWTDVSGLSHRRLAGNVIVAILLSTLFTYAAAWRLSRFKNWQFHLKDAIAVTLGVAVILGTAVRQENAYQADKLHLANLEAMGWDSHREKSIWYLLPLRDLGLLQDAAVDRYRISWEHPGPPFERFMFGRNPATLKLNEMLAMETSKGRRLSDRFTLESVQDPNLNDACIDALIRWAPSCQRLDIGHNSSISDASIAKIVAAWPSLKFFEFGSPNLTGETLQSLRKLKQLWSLVITDIAPNVRADEIRFVDDMPQIFTVSIPTSLGIQVSSERRQELKDRGIQLYGSQDPFAPPPSAL